MADESAGDLGKILPRLAPGAGFTAEERWT